ncbi:uncharacterized protein [Antedon mediterranea]|uniref:uncharacterized protein n=1 Tax=Antedon mediterranea TaxID=105859 RepID=UPI003AF46F34
MYWNILKYILPLITFYLVTGVSSSDCGGQHYCDDYDQYCCNIDECCYYTTYSYWNLWYFWFIIIFVLMTCFGGCGYYRRQYIHTSTGQRIPVNQTTYLTAGVQPTVVPVHGPYQQSAAMAPAGAFQSPPPYSEVTKQNVYPPNPAQAQYYQYQSQFYPYPAAAQPTHNLPPPPEYVPPQGTIQTTTTENAS